MPGMSKVIYRASKEHRCPVCHSDHSCSVWSDGHIFCWRTHADTPWYRWAKDVANGFGMLWPIDGDSAETSCAGSDVRRRGVQRAGRRDPERNDRGDHNGDGKEVNAEEIWMTAAVDAPDELAVLAHDVLGVSITSLNALGARYAMPKHARDRPAWLMPEKTPQGTICGLARRFPDGSKKQWPGTKRGLAYTHGWDAEIAGAILLVEGHSDTAACLTMGLTAIGRPSNTGGVEYLAELLAPAAIGANVPVLIVAENDRKPSGQWPGLHGAQQTAQALANLWERPVWVALPPDGIKDTRSWLNAQKLTSRELENREAMSTYGVLFLTALTQNAMKYNSKSGILRPDKVGQIMREIPGTVSMYVFSERMLSIFRRFKEEMRIDINNTIHSTVPGNSLIISTSPGPNWRSVIGAGLNSQPCPHHQVPLIHKREDIRQGGVIRADCRKWLCHSCGPRRRSLWLLHLAGCFHDWTGMLFCGTIPDHGSTVEKLRKWNNSHKDDRHEWVCVRLSSGQTFITHTRPQLPDFAVLPPDAVSEQLAAALLSIDLSIRQPVATSKGWALPQRNQGENEFVRYGHAPNGSYETAIEDVQTLADETSQTMTSDGKVACFFSLPEDVADDEAEVFYGLIGRGIDAVDRDEDEEG